MGAPLRAVGEAGPGGGPVTRGSGPGRSPAVPASGHRVQKRGEADYNKSIKKEYMETLLLLRKIYKRFGKAKSIS